MPIGYERDDRRRLIRVSVTEPHSIDDLLGVIDQQAADEAWTYAMLYDCRSLTKGSSEDDLQRIAGRVKDLSAARPRGPVGLAIRPHPALFQAGLLYVRLTRELMTVEVLLTSKQIDDWLARNTRS
jgi:hypothetical protein